MNYEQGISVWWRQLDMKFADDTDRPHLYKNDFRIYFQFRLRFDSTWCYQTKLKSLIAGEEVKAVVHEWDFSFLGTSSSSHVVVLIKIIFPCDVIVIISGVFTF